MPSLPMPRLSMPSLPTPVNATVEECGTTIEGGVVV